MNLKPLLPIMFLVSRVFSFQSRNTIRTSFNIIRMKKTLTNNYDSDSTPSSSRKSKTKNLSPVYRPRSENQKQYVTHLNNDSVPIVFGIGPAGCGKTLFACTTAIDGLKRGLFQKIVLTRPIVPVEEEELGFLPGTLVKKMDPWTRPLMDIFLEYYPQHELDFMLGSGVIEISPLAYMRGRTFKRCFIIADEMQNSTPNQMLMLTTRIGENSKMVITGDLKQSDRDVDNGLLDIMNKIKTYKNKYDNVGIEMVEMKYSDIERSPIVSKILEIYNNKNNVVSDDRMIHPVSKSVSEPLSVSVEKKVINNDAALIPLNDVSKNFGASDKLASFSTNTNSTLNNGNRYNSPGNINLIF
jgi:phosphate starvation-inducible protein PhoH and related proteins